MTAATAVKQFRYPTGTLNNKVCYKVKCIFVHTKNLKEKDIITAYPI